MVNGTEAGLKLDVLSDKYFKERPENGRSFFYPGIRDGSVIGVNRQS